MQFASYSPEFWQSLLSDNPIQGGWRRVFDGVAWAFLFIVNKPEDHLYYGGEYGLIITALVPFFFLGLWVIVWRVFRRDGGSALLVAWLAIVVAGGGLMSESFVSARFVLLFPALAIMIAVGIRYTLPLLVRPPERLMNIALIILGMLVVVVQVFYYFQLHLPQFETAYRAHRPYSDFEDALLRAQDFRDGTQVIMVMDHLFTASDNHNLMHFMRGGLTVETIHIDEFTPEYLSDLRRHIDHAFFLPSSYPDAQLLITETLGEREFQYTDNPYIPSDKQFVLYYYPALNYIPIDPTVRYTPENYEAGLRWLLLSVVMLSVGSVGTWRYRRKFPQLGQFVADGTDKVITVLDAIKVLITQLTQPLLRRLSPLLHFPRTISRLFIIGAGLLVGLATMQFQGSDGFTVGLGFAGFAMLLLGVGGYIYGRNDTHKQDNTLKPAPLYDTQSSNARGELVLLGCGLLALLTLFSITADDMAISASVQVLLWASGVFLLAVGLMGGFHLNPTLKSNLRLQRGDLNSKSTRTDSRPLSTGEGLGMGVYIFAILALALFLRVHDLEYGIHRFIDEQHSARAVVDLWDTPNTPILTQYGDVTAFTWFYPLMQSGSVALYGSSLTGLRVVSALVGVLNVWALWWLAKMLFDRQTALLAMLMLAIFPPHIHFSRIGINNVIDPLLGTLALAFLIHGLQSGRRAPFVFAGVMLGLTHYFYEGGRLIFTPLVIAFMGIMLFYYQYRAERVRWRYLGLTALMTIMLSLPVYFTWSANGLSMLPRLADERDVAQGMMNGSGLVDSLHVLLGLPETGWFYGGDVGLILPVVVPLFLLGLGFVLWRIRHPAMLLIVMWLGATVFGNSLLNDSTDSSRYVVVFPILALIIAIGIRETIRVFFAVTPNEPIISKQAWMQRLFTILIAIAIVVVNVTYYFGDYLDGHHEQFHPAIIADDVLFRAKTLPSNTTVYIVSNGWIWEEDIHTVLRFYGRQDDLIVNVISATEVTDAFIEQLPIYRTLAFFVSPNNNNVREALQAHFDIGDSHLSPYLDDPETGFDLYFFLGYQAN